MTRSAKGSRANEELPPAMRSLLRTFRLGYRAEPRLLALSLGLALLMMLPDALLALWLKFLVDGVLARSAAIESSSPVSVWRFR